MHSVTPEMTTPPRPSSHLSPLALSEFDPSRGHRRVLCMSDMPAGHTAAIFAGRIMSWAELSARWGPACIEGPGIRSSLQLEDDLYLVPDIAGPAEWIQHSCEPSLGFAGECTLVTLRRLRAGEELSFDFGTSDGAVHHGFRCDCRSPNCRKYVTSRDWLLPDLRQRLDGYFSGYLQRRLDQLEDEDDGIDPGPNIIPLTRPPALH